MIHSSNIAVVDLKQPPQRHVRVLVGQPTSSADDWVVRDDLYFVKKLEVFREQIRGIVVEAMQSTADMIILPELSVPLECSDLLQNWSAQTGGVAVAGSHYHNSNGAYRSRCPIIIAGQIFFTEKLTPAPMEVSPVKGQGPSAGSVVHVFKHSRLGDFAVLVCSEREFYHSTNGWAR